MYSIKSKVGFIGAILLDDQQLVSGRSGNQPDIPW
jgi:hypothetical protein